MRETIVRTYDERDGTAVARTTIDKHEVRYSVHRDGVEIWHRTVRFEMDPRNYIERQQAAREQDLVMELER